MIKAVSLFSSGGIGTMYFKDIGIDIVVANELIKKRCDFHKYLYPNTAIINGDIGSQSIKDEIATYISDDVKMLIATPPCQGVSTLGVNKKNADYISDKRNYLIYDVFYFIDKYDFDYIIIENVSRFLKMKFPTDDGFKDISEIVLEKYSNIYHIEILDLNAKDFGVPQSRPRCFIKLYKKDKSWINPKKEKEITLKEAIGHLPSLESGQDSGIKNHVAKKHNEREVLCMKYTATGESAMKNELYYPKKKDGEKIKGFHNTYKRLEWDKPCHARTTNSGNIGSHNNVHPGRRLQDGTFSDARVLTLRELFLVSSINPNLDIPESYSDTFIRHLVGEAVPPSFFMKMVRGVCDGKIK